MFEAPTTRSFKRVHTYNVLPSILGERDSKMETCHNGFSAMPTRAIPHANIRTLHKMRRSIMRVMCLMF